LPFSCSFVWSAFPPAGWRNLVLNDAMFPRDQLWDPTPVCFGTWPVPHPHSQPLCFSWPLLSARSSSGMLACQSSPALRLCSFPAFCWEFGTESESLVPCPNPILVGRFSIPPTPLLVVLDYCSLFIFFSFPGEGGSVCPGAVLGYFPRGWVGKLLVVHDAHLFFL
jgi:hypothetical protein